MASLSPKIVAFENESGYKLKINESISSDTVFDLINTKRDYMRIRNSGESMKVLRSKIYGVPVTVTMVRDGEFNFTNADMAEALEELATRLKTASKEISGLDEVDLLKEEGILKSTENESYLTDLESRIESTDDEESESDIENED